MSDRYLTIGVAIFFFKQKTAYEMRISDWSSDVCSSDLAARRSSALSVSMLSFSGGRRTKTWPAPCSMISSKENRQFPFSARRLPRVSRRQSRPSAARSVGKQSSSGPSADTRRAPTRSWIFTSFAARCARTTPASELRSAMAIASNPSAAAAITSSSGCEPARRKEKLLATSSGTQVGVGVELCGIACPSPEQPVQVPVAGGAVEPVAAAVLVFDAEVVARRGVGLFQVAAPPLAEQALGAFGAHHLMPHAAPAELRGRIVEIGRAHV